jgi:nucleotide-binding universal stress UspA family protein
VLKDCELLINKQRITNIKGLTVNSDFRRILLPINDSVYSGFSQQIAISLSKLFKSQVNLLYVAPKEPVSFPAKNYSPIENYAPISTATGQFPRALKAPPVKEYAIPTEVAEEIAESYRDEGQALLSDAARLFSEEGIASQEKLVEEADVAQAIVSEAQTRNCDLVIIGKNGDEKEETNKHFESIAEKVSAASETPILIARGAQLKRILILLEGSDADNDVLKKGYAMAEAAESHLILVYVQKRPHFKAESKRDETEVLARAAKFLEGVPFEQKIVSGNALEAIIQMAKRADIDLIVMSKGHGRLRDSSLGSLAVHVLRNAVDSVLLVG